MKVINPLKGKTDKSWFFEQDVYSPDGLIRAIKAGGGTGNLPKIIEYETTDHDLHQQPSERKATEH